MTRTFHSEEIKPEELVEQALDSGERLEDALKHKRMKEGYDILKEAEGIKADAALVAEAQELSKKQVMTSMSHEKVDLEQTKVVEDSLKNPEKIYKRIEELQNAFDDTLHKTEAENDPQKNAELFAQCIAISDQIYELESLIDISKIPQSTKDVLNELDDEMQKLKPKKIQSETTTSSKITSEILTNFEQELGKTQPKELKN